MVGRERHAGVQSGRRRGPAAQEQGVCREDHQSNGIRSGKNNTINIFFLLLTDCSKHSKWCTELHIPNHWKMLFIIIRGHSMSDTDESI